MSVNRVKSTNDLTDITDNPVAPKKTVLQPGRAIVNAYTLIAVLYCAFSAFLFYIVVQHIFLAIIHLLAMLVILTNYFILIQTKNFNRATTIILTTGTVVVVSLFATGGWANTGYLWPFAYLPFVFFLADRSVILNWVALLFAGCLLVTLLHFAGIITIPYSPAALGNYFAALLIFVICIFLFQKATIEREEFLSSTETLLEAAPDAVIIIDDDGRIVKWNPKSAVLFGWREEEILGKLLSEIIIPHRYREAHTKGLKHFLETGEGPVLGKTIEIQAIKKNDVEFDVALSISPTTVNKKHLFIGFVRDITKRKRAEEEIEESKQMFSNLFYKSPIMKCITEVSTGKFIEVNDAFANFVGYSKEQIPGKTSSELNTLALPEERNRIIQKIQENGYVRDQETQINDKNGIPRWLSTSIDLINLNGKDCLLTAAIDITTRKEAEEQIRQLNASLEQRIVERTEELYKSEKKYRNLFENNPMPMWVLDITTFRFLDVNEAAILHYGYSREEFLSLSAFDIRPDEEKERYRNADHAKNIYPANYNRGTWKHLKKDGTVINVEIIVHTIIFENKTARLVLSNDITEKIKAEEKLDRSIKEITDYKFALDESSIVAITDQKGIIKHANDNFCKISKYTREELIGQDHRLINSGFHPAEFIRNLWVTIANGKIWKGELMNKAKDGSIYWVDTTIIPFLDEKGKPYQYIAIRADITERKEAEQALAESQQLLSAIIENSTAVIYVKDLDGRYLLVNRRFSELFHRSIEDIIGKTDHDFFDKAQADAFREMDVRTANADHALTEEETVPQDDGLHTYVSVKSTLRDETGTPYGIFGISTDITERMRAQMEVQRLNEGLEQKVIDRTAELQAAVKELESFTYSVSHDLRSPLRIIDGYADILLSDFKDKLDKEGNRFLDIIKVNARRMGQLIDDLLSLSQTGRKELIIHRTDMNMLVKTVVDEQLFLAGNAATVKIENLEPAECDSGLLRQVWVNLISNALKYSGKKERPEIQITSLRKTNEIIYSIKDNGVGFNMQYAGKLFGVFQRLHKMTEFEGTGIGLALANRIITKHRGKIWAESEPNGGAIFYFSLPA